MIEMRLDKLASQKALRIINEAPEKLNQYVMAAMTKAGLEMKSDAQRMSPVKTGNLKRSINMRALNQAVAVGTNVVYARIHDLGGYAGRGRSVYIPKYKGRGYFTPAYKKLEQGRLKQILDEELRPLFR